MLLILVPDNTSKTGHDWLAVIVGFGVVGVGAVGGGGSIAVCIVIAIDVIFRIDVNSIIN